ncbi:unnamed protein product, partial [Rotaria sp. Silwood1]
MVSRYRDIIETNQTNFSRQPSIISTTPSIRHASIASIPTSDSTTINKNQLTESKLPDYPKANFNSNESSMNITKKLERALSNIAPFLRDIFIEFSYILTKTLVGSYGQELLPSGLHALKQTASVVELKHAGLAFIELVNEGRLLSHTSKDHVVKVANEADFIVNRMRADDICKASEFEQLSAQTTVECKSEKQLCEHFITAARQRHQFKIILEIRSMGEDDLRRRRRLIRNPNGSIHNEATQKSSFNNDDEILKVDEKDLDQDFSGPIRFSTECSLICGINIIRGTLAMTHNSMLFDADEYDESYIKIDSKMFSYIDNIHGKWHFNEIR